MADDTELFVEAHDLAASKLFAFREKDRDFVRVLVAEGLVSVDVLVDRIRDLPAGGEERGRLIRWVEITSEDLEV